MIAKASKEDLVETARILAMQAAHMTRKCGEQQLPDLAHLLSATTLDDESIALLRDGTEAFVGVLATVSGGTLDEIGAPHPVTRWAGSAMRVSTNADPER